MREDGLFTVRIELRMTHDMTDFDVSCVVVGVLRTSRYRRARDVMHYDKYGGTVQTGAQPSKFSKQSS